jgi:hypothetical protein
MLLSLRQDGEDDHLGIDVIPMHPCADKTTLCGGDDWHGATPTKFSLTR